MPHPGTRQDAAATLVPGRACGACTACCLELAIEDPVLSKPAGALCAHCAPGRGCGIYEARPATCRDWHCGWRALAWLGEAHRPDRWGVLVQVTADDIPRRYPRTGLVLNVLGGLAAVEDRRTVEVVGALVRERVPAFMGVKGPPGFGGTKVFLNDQLARAAKQRSGDRLRDALVDEYLFALAQPKLPTAAA